MGPLSFSYFLSIRLIELLKYVNIAYPNEVIYSVFDCFRFFPNTAITKNLKFKNNLVDNYKLPETFQRYELSIYIWNELK